MNIRSLVSLESYRLGGVSLTLIDEIRKHVELKAKLSSIPVRALRKVTGKDGKKYYRIDYEIRFKFFSAHIEYSLWYEDICYGTVDAKYE